MKDREQYEQICFEVISAAGSAKSYFLEAIENAKIHESYEELIKEGEKAFMEAVASHQKALQLEAEDNMDVGLLLIHAETILSSAEMMKDLCETIIVLIEK